MLLRKALWASGLRYRLHAKLPGRPDIAFTKVKVAVFIDGCFWHRCPLHGVMPKSNVDFWKRKLMGNVKRDRKNDALLQGEGWYVLRLWEHQVETELVKVVKQIVSITRKRGTKLASR